MATNVHTARPDVCLHAHAVQCVLEPTGKQIIQSSGIKPHFPISRQTISFFRHSHVIDSL